MKKYIVIYVNGNTENTEVDEEFNTKQQALNHIQRENSKEETSDWNESASWEYHVFEKVASFRTSVAIKADITTTEL